MKNKVQIAWSKAVNNKDNWSFRDPTYGNKVKGKLNIDHYITYNIVRGLPITRGFETTDSYDFKRYIYKLEHFVKNWSQGGIFDFFSKRDGNEWLVHFGGLVSEKDFREKADEALRLYRNS